MGLQLASYSFTESVIYSNGIPFTASMNAESFTNHPVIRNNDKNEQINGLKHCGEIALPKELDCPICISVWFDNLQTIYASG